MGPKLGDGTGPSFGEGVGVLPQPLLCDSIGVPAPLPKPLRGVMSAGMSFGEAQALGRSAGEVKAAACRFRVGGGARAATAGDAQLLDAELLFQRAAGSKPAAAAMMGETAGDAEATAGAA